MSANLPQRPQAPVDDNTRTDIIALPQVLASKGVVSMSPAAATPPAARPQVGPSPRSVAAANAPSPAATMLGFRPRRGNTAPSGTILGVVSRAEVDEAVARVRLVQRTPPPVARVQPIAPAVVPPVAVEAAAPAGKWGEFEELGLKPSRATSRIAKLIVSSYRMIGFLILTLIVLVLVGYITTTVFYFFNHSWVSPIAVSPSDEKVIALQSELAAQQNQRDQISDEVLRSERAIAAEQSFQLEFAQAIKYDLDGRKAELGRVRALAGVAARARIDIKHTNDAFASSSQQQMSDEYSAHMIDRSAMLAGKYQLAQISSSNLSMAERQAEFTQRAVALASETKSLDAILDNKVATNGLSYDVLKIKRDYETSKLELAKETQTHNSLKASLARRDTIIDSLKHSATLRALADHATVAFVPYGNLDEIKPGTRLYGCRLSMVGCRAVGTVLEILPGEITSKHPRRDKLLRGQMVELKLDADEASAAEDDLFFIGGAPLGL